MWYHVGSARELPRRTGFAHLFEHLMFMGSGHVKPGEFDEWLEAAGGDNNGSTENDRTNYWINVPSNALELALFLESDRMGYLLDSMTPKTVDAQRDVVKNERRQRYENRPYGMARGRRSARCCIPKAIRTTGRSSATCPTSPPRATTMWWRSSRSTTRRRTRAWSSPATSSPARRARSSRNGSAT